MMMRPSAAAAGTDSNDLGLSLSLSTRNSATPSNNDTAAAVVAAAGMNPNRFFFQMASPPPPSSSTTTISPAQLNLMTTMMPSCSSAAAPDVASTPMSFPRNFLTKATTTTTTASVWNNTNHLFHQYNSDPNSNSSSAPGLTGPAPPTTTTTTTFTGSAPDPRSYLKGIDVNRLPSSNNNAGTDDDGGVSSPNSTLSSLSGNNNKRRYDGDSSTPATAAANNFTPDDDDRACGGSDDEDGEAGRKKLRLSKDQSAVLEQSFKQHNTLNPKQKVSLAKRLGLRPRQVEVWFQNRRARTKLKQTEVDCEYLKRICDQLTEENTRLQKEAQELRALKLSPQFYMQMTPPTTLTMCPSCERVGGAGGGGGTNNNVTPTPSSSSSLAKRQRQQGEDGIHHWGLSSLAVGNGIRPAV